MFGWFRKEEPFFSHPLVYAMERRLQNADLTWLERLEAKRILRQVEKMLSDERFLVTLRCAQDTGVIDASEMGKWKAFTALLERWDQLVGLSW